MEIIAANTFTATIWVGRRLGYTDKILPMSIAYKIIHELCNEIGLCVTITETDFIYTGRDSGNTIDGEEPGFSIGLINYPLYPQSEEKIKEIAHLLAVKLKEGYQQQKVTIVYPYPHQTITIR